MIVASAIRLEDGQIFVGKRHSDALHVAGEILGICGVSVFEDGFITSNLEFLNRKEAYRLAKNNGQLNRKDTGDHRYKGKQLFSEDLW